MRNASFKLGLLAEGALVLLVGGFLAAAALPANAGTLRQAGSTGSNGSGTKGTPTGNYQFTYYDIGSPVGNNTETESPNYGVPGGDNVLRLVDPNGCGNSGTGNLACGSETNLCAMIYVFDDDQEMGECCGCPITPNGLDTFSVRHELVENWALATQDNSTGVIAVVSSSINDPDPLMDLVENRCGNGNNPACNDGCSPTLPPITTGATNLDGSITHLQLIEGICPLTETRLYDQGAGEPVNNAYLVAQCAALIGNGTNRDGFCYCNNLRPG